MPSGLPVLPRVAFHPVHHAVRAPYEPLENVAALTLVPAYSGACVVDASAGGGEGPINRAYALSQNADRVVIHIFEGKVFENPEAGQRQPVPTYDELDSAGPWKY